MRAWCLLPALLLVAAPARAQTTTTFTVDRLVMAGAPGDGFAIWRPDVAEKTRFFGQLGLGYALNPLRKDNTIDNLDAADKVKGNPLSRQITTYFDAGVEILNRASIHVSFPLVVNQAGSPTNPGGVLDTGVPATNM